MTRITERQGQHETVTEIPDIHFIVRTKTAKDWNVPGRVGDVSAFEPEGEIAWVAPPNGELEIEAL